MEIRPIEESEFPLWNAMVEKSPQGTLFHSAAWLKGSHLPLNLYGVFDNGRLVGGFAICRGRNGGLKSEAKHPAFTPYMGLVTIFDSERQVARLSKEKEIASLIAEYIKRDFLTIDVRFSPNVVDMQPFIWAGYSVSVRYTYIVDISDLNRTWAELEAKRRNDIRKAEKTGLSVKQDLELKDLLDVIRATLQRQGTWSPDYPFIIQRYDDSLCGIGKRKIFGVPNAEGELVAGIYIAWDNKRSYYLLGGYKDESCRGAPALALWEAMKFTRNELGLRQFDLEGSMVPGIEKFFRQFGGQLVPIYAASWIDPRWRPYATFRTGLSQLKSIFLDGKR